MLSRKLYSLSSMLFAGISIVAPVPAIPIFLPLLTKFITSLFKSLTKFFLCSSACPDNSCLVSCPDVSSPCISVFCNNSNSCPSTCCNNANISTISFGTSIISSFSISP